MREDESETFALTAEELAIAFTNIAVRLGLDLPGNAPIAADLAGQAAWAAIGARQDAERARRSEELQPIVNTLTAFITAPARLRMAPPLRLAAIEGVTMLTALASMAEHPEDLLFAAGDALRTGDAPADALPSAREAADIRAAMAAMIDLVLRASPAVAGRDE